jgi:hypothetical protein
LMNRPLSNRCSTNCRRAINFIRSVQTKIQKHNQTMLQFLYCTLIQEPQILFHGNDN